MCYDVGRAPILVYVRKCNGGGSAKIFDITRALLLLKKGVTENPLFDRIICLLDQFMLFLDRIMCMFDQLISKKNDQHWFILRKTSRKMQSCTRLCSLFSQTRFDQFIQ